ncbi:MAG: acyltransferase [Ferruginibacter sp.]|uniref:acyltransferase family protein n=1 Tax=Ferruginibacter sp. TaxID=1940288 RepID=UPI002657DCB6|nr:acyltransferase [Ferruginibacter sp.]MDB5275833.1 acyltransferase [Ferruginibacter sp.]
MSQTKEIHKQLPNLDSVRAIAALIVVFSHIELQKQELGLANIRPVVRYFGSIGVTIFFVLSGFLITYLLFKEHTSKTKINITSFYFRRILRIWPLYFMVLLFGVFVYPGNVDNAGIVFSVFFLPNIAFMLGKLPGLIDPIWSLGVEEQFYLFHPHIFSMKNLKRIFNTLIGIFIFFYILKFCAAKLHWETVSTIMYKARFDCMMLGGVFSMWIVNYHKENKYFNTLFSPSMLFTKTFQRILYTFYVAYLVMATVNTNLYSDQFLSILTAGVIGNLALNPDCIISLQSRFLSFVGKISFGLYLLHKFPVELMIRTAKAWHIENLVAQNLFIYSSSVTLALGIAWFSFNYYEAYFLRLKDRKFSTPATGLMKMKAVQQAG